VQLNSNKSAQINAAAKFTKIKIAVAYCIVVCGDKWRMNNRIEMRTIATVGRYRIRQMIPKVYCLGIWSGVTSHTCRPNPYFIMRRRTDAEENMPICREKHGQIVEFDIRSDVCTYSSA
jgi:hypothetical protein